MAAEERDHRTVVLRSNQAKLDELEYFLEAIGVALFGDEGRDVRGLRRYLPEGSNLSLLVDAARVRAGRDVAADLKFLVDDLGGSGTTAAEGEGLFDFRPYLLLRARAGRLLEQIEEGRRAPIAELLARDLPAVEAALARVNAYAWLELVGLPDLRVELDPSLERVARLEPDERLTRRGLEAIARALAGGVGGALAPLLGRGHYLLSLEYRDQLRRLLDRGASVA